MVGLLIGYGFGLLSLLTPLLARNRMIAQLEDADEQRLIDLRQWAERPAADWFLAVWSLLCVVGAVFLLARGHGIGWAWLGVAVVFAAAIMTGRWARKRMLVALGDRGRVERSVRYRARAATSYRWGAVGVTGYVGSRIVQYAYPGNPPPGAEVAIGAFSLVMILGFLGFLAVRTRMYLQGDDLQPAPDRAGSTDDDRVG